MPSRATVHDPGKPPREVPLGPGASLDLLPAARLLGCEAPGVVVEAAGRGVRVDGRRLRPGERRLLRPGRWARAGATRITASWEEPGTAVVARAILGAALRGEPTGPGPELVVLEGPEAGRRLRFAAGVVGRGRSSSVRVDDPSVSRVHLRATLEGGRVRVRDAGGRNGSWLGGGRLRGVRELSPGEELRAGRTVLALLVAAAGETPAPVEARPSKGRARRAVALAAAALALGAAALLLP